jgi:hypothetical protein
MKRQIAHNMKLSPIRLITIALIPALLADKRVDQKLISKKEHKPTPSQPINN